MAIPLSTVRLTPERRIEIIDRLTRALESDPAPIAFAFLFGSSLDTDVVHDIDVGVYYFPAPIDALPSELSRLATQLNEATGLPIDVRPLHLAPISFLYHALRGRLLVCRDEGLMTSVMEDTARQYLDLEPLLRHGAKEAFAA